jgi:hypothetical protein
MRILPRILVIAGLGLFTALTVGTGAVQAKPGNGSHSGGHAQRDPFGGYARGYYSSWRECDTAGFHSARYRRWNDYNCNYVLLGPGGSTWGLRLVKGYGRLNYDPRRRGWCYPARPGFPGSHKKVHSKPYLPEHDPSGPRGNGGSNPRPAISAGRHGGVTSGHHRRAQPRMISRSGGHRCAAPFPASRAGPKVGR